MKHSTSLKDIWPKNWQRYDFQSTGAQCLDLGSINLQPAEKPEDPFQHLMAFLEDNLLSDNCGLTHHGEQVTVDEDLSPTLENTIIFLWLKLIHPGLPILVKEKYGCELHNKSLASLKPEISQALEALLEELCSVEDTKAMPIGSFKPRCKIPAVVRVSPIINSSYPAFCGKLLDAPTTPMALWIAISYLSGIKDLGLTPFAKTRWHLAPPTASYLR